MGNAGAKSELRVEILEGSYRPGEEVVGTVSLYLAKKSPNLVLELELIGEESYAITDAKPSNRREKTCNYRAILFDSKLEKGFYQFPFTIHLPSVLPNSFSLQTRSFSASISYFLRASLPQLLLISVFPLNITNFNPSSRPIQVEETYPLTCCCFNSDFMRVTAHLDRGEYCCSDDVLVTIGIDTLGASQGVESIRLEIVQITLLRRGNNVNSMCFSHIVLSCELPFPLHSHTIYTEGNALQALLSLQSTALAGTTHGSIVESGLRVDIKVRTDSGKELLLSLPLRVRNKAGLGPYSPPLPSGWKPEVMSAVRMVCGTFSFPLSSR